MRKFLLFIIFSVGFSNATFSSALALAIPAENFPGMELEELKNELKDAQYFADLDRASSFINLEERCGIHTKNANELQQKMATLKAKTIVENRTTKAQAMEYSGYQDDNRVALFDYRACFTRNLVGYPALTDVGIMTYEAHKVEFDAKKEKYSNVPVLNNYIAALKNAIENIEQNEESDFAAEIASAHQSVEVLQGGRGTKWEKVGPGYKLRIKDELRTGPEGRARILFADRYDADNAGPTVVNVGSASHIRMEKFTVEFSGLANRQTILELIRGTLRAYTKNWGFRSSFQVRSAGAIASSGSTSLFIGGNAQIGFRQQPAVPIQISHFIQSMFIARAHAQSNSDIFGTEVGVEYNPDNDIFTAHLARGSASINHNGQRIALEPKTSRTIAFGNISPPRPLTTDIWGAVVASTGDGYEETDQKTRIASVREDSIKPNTLVGLDDPKWDAIYKRTSRSYARTLVTQMFRGLNQYDEQLFESVIGGELDASYRKNRRNSTFRSYIDGGGQRPQKWTSQCSVCWTDPGEKERCQVQIFVETARPEDSKHLIFSLENISGNVLGDKKITKGRLSSGEALELFQRRNPTCGENY